MTDIEDDIDRLALDARAAAKKVASELADAATSMTDQARDSARRVFDKIKAARLRAETKAND